MVKAFLADTAPDKRAKKIDQLIASDAFNDRWTLWFGDLVQNVRRSTNSNEQPQGRNAYYNFIRGSIAANKPYDQMVREILSTSGDAFADASGGANYYIRQLQPNGPIQDTYDNLAAASGEKFLGMPVLCISCHNGLGHLDSVNTYLKGKSRYDFWGNAAFFSRARVQNTGTPVTPHIIDNPAGQYLLNTTSGNKTARQPVNGQNSVPPTFLLTVRGEGFRLAAPAADALAAVRATGPEQGNVLRG